jgi:hypothetical protein
MSLSPLFCQLDIDAGVKAGAEETKQITQWLGEQGAARGLLLYAFAPLCQRIR